MATKADRYEGIDGLKEAYRWLMDNPKKELLFVGMGVF